MSLGNRNNQHSFAQIPAVNQARSQFDRSFSAKDTMGFDKLYPFFVDEVIPGDTSRMNLNLFARLNVLVNPIMDNVYMDFHFFFVPMRLVWDNWEKFCGAQDNPGDSTDFIIPTLPYDGGAGTSVATIYDHMGLPIQNLTAAMNVNALPFRSYVKIFNDWYRDQNLQNSEPLYTDNGPDAQSDYSLLDFNKKHDYFTSCLPWPQKGTAVDIPWATDIPIISDGTNPNFTNTTNANQTLRTSLSGGFNSLTLAGAGVTGNENTRFGTNTGLEADIANSVVGTINDLREAMQIQSILELDARGGTRYVEILLSHYNVVSPDFRLQRSEFLGGGTVRINMHPVAQTSQTSGSAYQGNLAAFATGASSGSAIGFTKSFVEHGYVLGIARARGEVTYQQGLHRMWSRSTRFDFFWPKLQQIGEQAVLLQEVYASGTATDEDVFGYQERYAEYKYSPSQIRGYFRSVAPTNIDSWHLAEEFVSAPSLGTLVPSVTPVERILASLGPGSAPILIDYWFDYKQARPMMTYGVPATFGRF